MIPKIIVIDQFDQIDKVMVLNSVNHKLTKYLKNYLSRLNQGKVILIGNSGSKQVEP